MHAKQHTVCATALAAHIMHAVPHVQDCLLASREPTAVAETVVVLSRSFVVPHTRFATHSTYVLGPVLALLFVGWVVLKAAACVMSVSREPP